MVMHVYKYLLTGAKLLVGQGRESALDFWVNILCAPVFSEQFEWLYVENRLRMRKLCLF
jgi:hypothetical protein